MPTQYVRFTGSADLRMRLVCATLSGRALRCVDRSQRSRTSRRRRPSRFPCASLANVSVVNRTSQTSGAPSTPDFPLKHSDLLSPTRGMSHVPDDIMMTS